MKAIRILLALVTSGYLAMCTSPLKKPVDSEKNRLKLGIKDKAEHHKDIRDYYINKYRFPISKSLMEEIEEVFKNTIELTKSSEAKKSKEIDEHISIVKKWQNSLKELSPKKVAYENFIETCTKELWDLKTKHINECTNMRDALKKYEDIHVKKTVSRPKEDQKYFDKYNTFMTNLSEIIRTTETFDTDLKKKFTNYIADKQLTAAEKANIYTNISIFLELRIMCDDIFNLIDLGKNNVRENSFLNSNSTLHVHNTLIGTAIEIEKEEYSKSEQLKSIGTEFFTVLSEIDKLTDLSDKKIVLGVKVKEVQTIIRKKFAELEKELEGAYTNTTNPIYTIKKPEFQGKINLLLDYQESVIDAIVKTIESNTYTDEQKKINNDLFTGKPETKMVLQEPMDTTSIITSFGAELANKNSPQADNNKNITVSPLTNSLVIKTYLDAKKTSEDKKNDLERLAKILDKIETLLRVCLNVLLENISDSDYIDLENNAGLCLPKYLCYAAAMKKIKENLGYETPLYIDSLLNFEKEIYENRTKKYTALNQDNYLNLQKLPFNPLLTRSKKILKYLQVLINQYSMSISEIHFFLTKEEFEKQNDLAQKICSIGVDKELDLSKSFALTEEIRVQTKVVVSNGIVIMNSFRDAKSINNNKTFYTMWDSLEMSARAIKTLQLYIESNAQETLDVFTAYEKAGILDKLKELHEKKESKEVKESKKAFLVYEKIILNEESHIPRLLSKIGTENIELYDQFVDSFYDSERMAQFLNLQVSSSSNTKYFIALLVFVVVGATARAAYFYSVKQKKTIIAAEKE